MIEWIAIGGLVAWALRAQTTAQELDDVDAIDNEPMMTFSNGVRLLAKAIARQEGFGVPGAAPTRNHNPGDLTGTRWTGVVSGAENLAVFATDADGWDALHRQLQLIADGRSGVYSRQMTIAQMAEHYAPKPNPAVWAANVAAFAGFTPDTTLDTVFS